MTVKCELYVIREDGVVLLCRWSDMDVMIRKIGTDEVYSEAIDVENAPWTYEETDIPIPKDPEVTT